MMKQDLLNNINQELNDLLWNKFSADNANNRTKLHPTVAFVLLLLYVFRSYTFWWIDDGHPVLIGRVLNVMSRLNLISVNYKHQHNGAFSFINANYSLTPLGSDYAKFLFKHPILLLIGQWIYSFFFKIVPMMIVQACMDGYANYLDDTPHHIIAWLFFVFPGTFTFLLLIRTFRTFQNGNRIVFNSHRLSKFNFVKICASHRNLLIDSVDDFINISNHSLFRSWRSHRDLVYDSRS